MSLVASSRHYFIVASSRPSVYGLSLAPSSLVASSWLYFNSRASIANTPSAPLFRS